VLSKNVPWSSPLKNNKKQIRNDPKKIRVIIKTREEVEK
jgi:hypothetical protein